MPVRRADGEQKQHEAPSRNRFGTFAGVFTPAILTILGVIMFMRATFVVGQAGVVESVLILVLAKSITFTTALSIGAISTNMRMSGGGSYFLVSRVLGPEYGGAIGLALFAALALSVPFYILGFTEAVVSSWPAAAPYFRVISLATAFVLFAVAYHGARLAIKTQFVVMAVLFCAIAAFLIGGVLNFSPAAFLANLEPLSHAEGSAWPVQPLSFWAVFAIYFPAVTGIDAGLNMSGDLAEPQRSIPRGTLAAVGVGFAVYLLQLLVMAGQPRHELLMDPFGVLRDNAPGKIGGTLVILGVVAASLSSAVGSYLGAPRVLQAISRDRILPVLAPFAKGAPKGDEPRRALLLTLGITVAVLLWAGEGSGGGALNAVAAVVTMFFLYSYGMINLAAFLEDVADNPSFRPTFRYFHWSIALLGGMGCLAVSFLVNWVAAVAAIAVVAGLLFYLKTRQLARMFGDARRGFVFRSLRRDLYRLQRMESDARNWRPVILVFSGNPSAREGLVTMAVWLEAGRGLVYLAYVLTGEFEDMVAHRAGAVRAMSRYCVDKNIEAFPVAVVAENVVDGTVLLLQAAVFGPVHPNVAMWGWPTSVARAQDFGRKLQVASRLGMNLLLAKVPQVPEPYGAKRIDIWWRGQKNGELMILLAYLLTTNWQWHRAEIRVLRVVEKEEGREPAKGAMAALLAAARVEGKIQVIVSTEPFQRILHAYSSDASLVVLGFESPEPGGEREWFLRIDALLEKLPCALLVNASEEGLLVMMDRGGSPPATGNTEGRG